MISDVSYLLKCPVCASSMKMDDTGRVLRCTGARVHCYDVARSGYLNLTSPGDGEGDLKDAVRARTLFLNGGYYEPLSNEINDVLNSYRADIVLDAGCGEGYYTNRMAKGRQVLGVDLSRAGIDSAAKYAKQNGGASFAVGSIFKIPVLDGTVDAVTNLFAPCAETEFSRVLKPDGKLLLVGAGPRHLFGLKELIYDDPYLNPGRADLPTQMQLLERRRLTYTICVEGKDAIAALFSMTPYYWRTSDADRRKLDSAQTLSTEVDFDIFLYGKGQAL